MKKAIDKDFKYPRSLDDFKLIEEALRVFAPDDGKAGIKILEKGNIQYKMELKVLGTGKRYRIYSKYDDGVFNVYGLGHK